jgi:integrase
MADSLPSTNGSGQGVDKRVRSGDQVRIPRGKPTHKSASTVFEVLKARDWLTDPEIAELVQQPGKYRIGPRVTLACARPGRGTAELRYMLHGRTRWMGLGGWPEVSVVEIRRKAEAAVELLHQGIDPLEQKAAEKQAAAVAAARSTTFARAASRYLADNETAWRNPKHRAQWRSTLTTYAASIANTPVADIDTPAVYAAISPIWSGKPETASRVRGRIEAVLGYAIAQRWRPGPNPATWKGNLEHLLPKKGKVRVVKHHAALPYHELPEFMRELATRDGVAVLALRFLILTAARSGEVRLARWNEVDLRRDVWVVPPSRMKAHREHRVPLSKTALAVLQGMQPLRQSGDSLIFPGMKRDTPLSDMTMTAVLRRMGRGDLTAHGFRSTFRTWCAEETSTPNHVAEQALAHAIGNAVEAAYRRGDLFAKRVELMDAWGNYCGNVP